MRMRLRALSRLRCLVRVVGVLDGAGEEDGEAVLNVLIFGIFSLGIVGYDCIVWWLNDEARTVSERTDLPRTTVSSFMLPQSCSFCLCIQHDLASRDEMAKRDIMHLKIPVWHPSMLQC